MGSQVGSQSFEAGDSVVWLEIDQQARRLELLHGVVTKTGVKDLRGDDWIEVMAGGNISVTKLLADLYPDWPIV